MENDIKKTIVFQFKNKFTGNILVQISMPYIPYRSIFGFYSRQYIDFKNAAANGFEKSLTIGKVWYHTKKTDRIVMTFPKGYSVDLPFDVNEKDKKIILHHLEGFKMACEK